MFDGVRLHICSDSTARWLVYESQFRDQFHTETYTSTGEIKSINKNGRHTGIKYILDLPHLSLTITVVALRHIIIVGSLHKFYHGDNYSDFHHSEIAEAIHILSQLLRTNPADIAIHNLEVGVNTSPLFNPYEFCDNLIAYKDKPFHPFKHGHNKSEIGFEASKLQYNIKVYDKGKQYLLSENILRYEYKAKVMHAIRHSGIHTLADLLDRDKVACLKNILLASFDSLIINDPTVVKSNLTRHECDIYTECLNPKMWKQYNPDKYYKRKRQFNEITDEFGAYKWRSSARRLISHKFDLLLYHSPIATTDVLIRGIDPLPPIF